MERLTEKQLHILRQKLCDMKNRCYNPQNKFYKDYGGRGITVCGEWKNDRTKFFKWAINNGYRDDLTIERINVNGNYEPSNCCWIPMSEQYKNKQSNSTTTTAI